MKNVILATAMLALALGEAANAETRSPWTPLQTTGTGEDFSATFISPGMLTHDVMRISAHDTTRADLSLLRKASAWENGRILELLEMCPEGEAGVMSIFDLDDPDFWDGGGANDAMQTAEFCKQNVKGWRDINLQIDIILDTSDMAAAGDGLSRMVSVGSRGADKQYEEMVKFSEDQACTHDFLNRQICASCYASFAALARGEPARACGAGGAPIAVISWEVEFIDFARQQLGGEERGVTLLMERQSGRQHTARYGRSRTLFPVLFKAE